jgi:hypothetical protein
MLQALAATDLPTRWMKNTSAVEMEDLYDMHRRCGSCCEELLCLEAVTKLPQRSRKGAVVALLAKYGRARKRFCAPPLLAGEALMEAFGLSPGEQLGDLLRRLKKAQDLGSFRDQEGALAWADRFRREGNGG